MKPREGLKEYDMAKNDLYITLKGEFNLRTKHGVEKDIWFERSSQNPNHRCTVVFDKEGFGTMTKPS